MTPRKRNRERISRSLLSWGGGGDRGGHNPGDCDQACPPAADQHSRQDAEGREYHENERAVVGGLIEGGDREVGGDGQSRKRFWG